MNDKIFNPNPKDLIKVIDNLYSSMNNYNIEVINLISNLEKENIERYKDILKKQGDKLNFNIFDIITDKWKRENLHSEILKFLLENYEEFFDNFLDLIKIKNKEEYSNAKITNEEAKIDILIKSENKAIIVENKINWAKDMPEQLFRYYNECKYSKGLEVDRIVYLSPNSSKEPADDSVKEIPKELIKTIVGFDGSKNDLVSCLEKSRDKLKENLEKTKNNLDSEDFNKLFFINHYIEILKRTGAGDMSEVELNFFKEIMEKYKSDKDIFKKIKYIGEMYNSLTLIRVNNLINKFNGKNWCNKCCYIQFPSEKRGSNYGINIYSDNYQYSLLQLFSYENSEQDMKDIKTWLKKHKLFDGFYFYNEGDEPKRWTKEFKFPEEENALYDFTDKLIKCLEEDVESIYNSGK